MRTISITLTTADADKLRATLALALFEAQGRLRIAKHFGDDTARISRDLEDIERLRLLVGDAIFDAHRHAL